jgi:kumamolisin
VVGGTSAVAPLWAGLVALLNESLGSPLGFAQPRLYSAAGFHDITSGDNGAYDAGPGWDACTGLGSPDGSALLSALQGGAGGEGGDSAPHQ